MAGGLRVLCTVLCLSQALLLSCCVASPSLAFRAEPMSVILSQGSTVHLRCSVRPNSASLSLSWRFRGQLLDPVTLPGVELSKNRGSLVLSSLQHIHQGLYQCVVQSDAGAIISRHARVAIADIGEYGEMRRRSLVVQEGSSVVIECPLPPSNPPALPRLRVRGEWLEKSIGSYLLQGFHHFMSNFYNTSCFSSASDDPSPWRIVYPVTPTTLSVEHSSMLVLECVVSGSPSPAAQWLKNGQEVALPAVPAGASRKHNNLVLLNLKRSDGGNYLCSVTTETGRNLLSVNYTVNVLEEASVERNLSDQSVLPGDAARFTCVAKGNPTPNVTWLFNSAPVAPSPLIQISGSSLCIKGVTSQDVGVYQCLVDNGIGSAQSAGRLTLQSEEQEPQPGSTTDILINAPPPSVHPIQSDEGDDLLPPEEEGLGEGDGLWDTTGQPTERSSDRPTPEAPIITSPPQTHKPDVYDLEWRAGRDWGHPINAYFVKYRKVSPEGEKLQALGRDNAPEC
eukprot:XP_014071026.1 PREDICTED: cell adhesion molecule-related/down-regulated by oncogenes-like [Salmo salar]